MNPTPRKGVALSVGHGRSIGRLSGTDVLSTVHFLCDEATTTIARPAERGVIKRLAG